MPDKPTPPESADVNPGPSDSHQEAVIQADKRSRQEQGNRGDELRRNMMRSIVTEPLLTKVQQAAPEQKFEVIISLNELFKGGIDAAMRFVKERADRMEG